MLLPEHLVRPEDRPERLIAEVARALGETPEAVREVVRRGPGAGAVMLRVWRRFQVDPHTSFWADLAGCGVVRGEDASALMRLERAYDRARASARAVAEML